MNAAEFLKKINNFFSVNFPDFIAVEPGARTSRYLFYENYKKYGLSIVVLTPVRIKNGELEFIPASVMKIAVELRITKTKQPIVVLVGTEIHAGSNWKKILEKKIRLLLNLMKEIRQCDGCGDFMLPRTFKQKKTGTWFVSFYCRKCNQYQNTTFGIGLKEKLHRNIRKKRT